jgi:hypothetical protein
VVETTITVKIENGKRRRKMIDWLYECLTKTNLNERGREIINWLIKNTVECK